MEAKNLKVATMQELMLLGFLAPHYLVLVNLGKNLKPLTDDRSRKKGSVQEIAGVPQHMKRDLCRNCLRLQPEQHVKIRAAFKKRTDTERCAGMQILRMKSLVFYCNTQWQRRCTQMIIL